MKVNLLTQNYYPNCQRNNVHFGQTPQDRKQQYVNAVNGRKDREAVLGGDFPYSNVVDYILTNRQEISGGSYSQMSPKGQAKRDFYLAAVCGDDHFAGDPYDDDLESVTY